MAQPSSQTPTVRFLYLVQHGQAKPEEEDPEKGLSDEGRRTVKRMAAWAAGAGVEVQQIWHSGKLRAGQTADIFAAALKPALGVAARSGLGPKDDVRPLAEAIEEGPPSLMLVGHLPFLAHLAGLLLTGDREAEPVRFCYGGIVGLLYEEGRWSLGCFLPPQFAP
jgi:phosphohistidine phosphatase